ncbi:MAG: histidine phosphatase family protein [Roseiflexaceae bacterium]
METPHTQFFPPRRRLYLLRHGDVAYYVDGRPVPPDGVDLTEEGRRQAEATGLALADVPFDRAVSTGLPRTDQTIRLVLGERDLAVEQIPELREIRGGRNEDLIATGRAQELFINALIGPLTREDRFLAGESFGDFQDRVLPAFRALLADPSWHNLLLVAHGATNRVILCDLIGLSIAGIGHFEQDPTCVNIIDFDAHGYPIVRLINYTVYNGIKAGDTLTTMERFFLRAQGL